MPRASQAKPGEIKFSNLDKVFFPKTGFTKGDLIKYYVEAADFILPHLKDRPITLIRFPEGAAGEHFYEKNAPHFTPSWVRRFAVARRKHEGAIDYILINDARTLAWCANLAAIELHPFLHRVPAIDRPTQVAFDLDPGEGADLLTCADVAFRVKEVMEGLGLEALPKVSGSKGIQIYVPLNTRVSYADTGGFAKAVADLLGKRHPDLVVSNMLKSLRKGRVLIDWSQNSQSKTTVGVYSMRAKREEPFVSMPVTWNELKRMKDPAALFFGPAAALKRMKKLGDLFAPVLTLKQRLPAGFSGLAKPAREPTGPGAEKKSLVPARASSGAPRGSLRAYRLKRDFTKTKEPAPAPVGKSAGPDRNFVIQKHAATHLHYDFRLEMGGTLKSWAVPKGIPLELGIKRSAFAVEDHPLGYMRFEGTIPKGQYGGGTVMVWDIGTYRITKGNFASGSFHFDLAGKKLRGAWHIFKIRSDNGKDVWLIEKEGEAMKPLTARQDDASVLTRRSMARIGGDNDAQWNSK